jgi:sugar phosphate isomerase/epimerase
MTAIAFSTLACPNWQIESVIAKATEYGYDGIEWRGGSQGHVRLDMPAAKKTLLRQRCSDAGIKSLAVTTYTSFVSNLAEERWANVGELRRYADLAAELGASYIRAFLGKLPEGTNPDPSLYKMISDCLNAASEYADALGVKIAIEPHDDFVRSADVLPLFDQPPSHHPWRVIWDIGNAFAAGEDPAAGYALLKNQLAYVQVKDGKGRASSWRLCPLGEGDVPLSRAFELLLADGYRGAFSVEWEYAWHPELDPPETALPAALKTLRGLLAAAQPESA